MLEGQETGEMFAEIRLSTRKAVVEPNKCAAVLCLDDVHPVRKENTYGYRPLGLCPGISPTVPSSA